MHEHHPLWHRLNVHWRLWRRPRRARSALAALAVAMALVLLASFHEVVDDHVAQAAQQRAQAHAAAPATHMR